MVMLNFAASNTSELIKAHMLNQTDMKHAASAMSAASSVAKLQQLLIGQELSAAEEQEAKCAVLGAEAGAKVLTGKADDDLPRLQNVLHRLSQQVQGSAVLVKGLEDNSVKDAVLQYAKSQVSLISQWRHRCH
jgi:hypothetical protein